MNRHMYVPTGILLIGIILFIYGSLYSEQHHAFLENDKNKSYFHWNSNYIANYNLSTNQSSKAYKEQAAFLYH